MKTGTGTFFENNDHRKLHSSTQEIALLDRSDVDPGQQNQEFRR
jgi:hypothetical protein